MSDNGTTTSDTNGMTNATNDKLIVENGEIRFEDACGDVSKILIYSASKGSRLIFEPGDLWLDQPLAAALAFIIAHFARTGRLENPPPLDRKALGIVAREASSIAMKEYGGGLDSFAPSDDEEYFEPIALAVADYVRSQVAPVEPAQPEPELDREWLGRLALKTSCDARGFHNDAEASWQGFSDRTREIWGEEGVAFARAVLARYGQRAPQGVVSCKYCSGTGYMGHGKDNTATACPDCKGTGQAALSALQPAGSEGVLTTAIAKAREVHNWRGANQEAAAAMDALTAERDQLRAEVERLKERDRELGNVLSEYSRALSLLTEEKDKLKLEVERLDKLRGMWATLTACAVDKIDEMEQQQPTPPDPRRVYDGMRVVINDKYTDIDYRGKIRTVRKASIEGGFIWQFVDDAGRVQNTISDGGTMPFYYDPMPAAEPAAEPPKSFQSRVRQWVVECFGEAIADNKLERCHRFIEEALELVQAVGMPKDDALKVLNYVYSKQPSTPSQDVGGVLITLSAMCSALSIDMLDASEKELLRIWNKIGTIRANHAAKPKPSFDLAANETAKPEEKQREWAGEQAEPVIVLPEAEKTAEGHTQHMWPDGAKVWESIIKAGEWYATKIDGYLLCHDTTGSLLAFPTPLAAARALYAIGQGPGAGKVETCPKCEKADPDCKCPNAIKNRPSKPEPKPAEPAIDVERLAGVIVTGVATFLMEASPYVSRRDHEASLVEARAAIRAALGKE